MELVGGGSDSTVIEASGLGPLTYGESLINTGAPPPRAVFFNWGSTVYVTGRNRIAGLTIRYSGDMTIGVNGISVSFGVRPRDGYDVTISDVVVDGPFILGICMAHAGWEMRSFSSRLLMERSTVRGNVGRSVSIFNLLIESPPGESGPSWHAIVRGNRLEQNYGGNTLAVRGGESGVDGGEVRLISEDNVVEAGLYEAYHIAAGMEWDPDTMPIGTSGNRVHFTSRRDTFLPNAWGSGAAVLVAAAPTNWDGHTVNSGNQARAEVLDATFDGIPLHVTAQSFAWWYSNSSQDVDNHTSVLVRRAHVLPESADPWFEILDFNQSDSNTVDFTGSDVAFQITNIARPSPRSSQIP